MGSILSALGMGLIVFRVLLAGTYGWWKALQPFSRGEFEISPFGLSPTPVFILAGGIILLCFALCPLGTSCHYSGKDATRKARCAQRPRDYFKNSCPGGSDHSYRGFLFSMALFLQIALGLNAMQTGFLYLPLSIPLLVASLTASRLSTHIAPKRIIQIVLLVLIAGLLLAIATINVEVRGLALLTGFALIGIGVGVLASQIMNLVLSQVAPERTSETAALMSISQNLGMAVGTALMGSIVIVDLVGGDTTLIDNSLLSQIISNPT
ncbi:MAG TPA: MFS transporter [Methanosarcina sp.]